MFDTTVKVDMLFIVIYGRWKAGAKVSSEYGLIVNKMETECHNYI